MNYSSLYDAFRLAPHSSSDSRARPSKWTYTDVQSVAFKRVLFAGTV